MNCSHAPHQEQLLNIRSSGPLLKTAFSVAFFSHLKTMVICFDHAYELGIEEVVDT